MFAAPSKASFVALNTDGGNCCGQRPNWYLLGSLCLLTSPIGVSKVAATLDSLRTSYLADSAQLGDCARLSHAVSKKLGEMEIDLRLRKAAVSPESRRAVVETNIGQDYPNAIREGANALITSATAERTRSTQRIHRSLDVSRIGITKPNP